MKNLAIIIILIVVCTTIGAVMGIQAVGFIVGVILAMMLAKRLA